MTSEPVGEGRTSPVLSIELSQRAGGVAVVDASGRNASVDVVGGRRETDDLAPAVATVLEQAGLDPADLEGVAVDVGPGGFTGVRVSVAFAQMFAEAIGVPVFAAPSPLVAIASASGLEDAVGTVDVCVAAKNESAWRTRFGRATVGGMWQICEAGCLIEAAGDLSQVDLLLADEHLGATLREAYRDSEIRVIKPAYSASALGGLVLDGHPDVRRIEDPAQLLPIYPRDPEAVRVWRNRIPR